MGRRTLTVSEITFNRRRNPAQVLKPSSLDDEHFFDLLLRWEAELSHGDNVDLAKQTWVQVQDINRWSEYVMLMKVTVGSFGEEGVVYNTGTGEPTHRISVHDAPTGETRILFFVPEDGSKAFVFSEESSRGSGTRTFLNQFKRYLAKNRQTLTLTYSKICEGDVWLENAKASEVEIRTEGCTPDIADGPALNIGKLSYIIKPAKNQIWPFSMVKKFRNKDVAETIVGVKSLADDYDIYVTMKSGERTKKFELGDYRTPAIREVLNESDEEVLSDQELINRCTERMYEFGSRLGFTWLPKWSEKDTPLQS